MIEGKFTDKTHLISVTVISVLFVSITGGDLWASGPFVNVTKF